jgi:argininosuccinate lyase
VLSASELIAILQGLEQIGERAASSPNLLEDDEAEDVHHFVEKHLVALSGEVAYKLHSGRSRNEQIATDLRLYVRAAIDQIRVDLTDALSVFLDRVEQAGNAAMPAYTHLQRAEPVLVAHWLLAYVEMFLRDAERLADCGGRANLCPLGSGAVAGATLPLDRRAMAEALGFEAPTANSIDATSDRDFVLEFAAVLSVLALHLSRWAEEMILFSSQEFGFIRLPEAYSTGSSAMPQKKNPDLLELTRGKAGRVIGDATALLVTVKALPLAYNKDLQETQEPLFDAAGTVLALLPLVTGWMKAMEFDHERLQAAAESGFMNAWAAATYLVRRGVPFRLAHEQIGKAVQACVEKRCELADLPLEELRQLNPTFDPDFYSCLSLQAVLNLHDVPGGTAPARVRQALAEARRRVESMREEVHAHA